MNVNKLLKKGTAPRELPLSVECGGNVSAGRSLSVIGVLCSPRLLSRSQLALLV